MDGVRSPSPLFKISLECRYTRAVTQVTDLAVDTVALRGVWDQVDSDYCRSLSEEALDEGLTDAWSETIDIPDTKPTADSRPAAPVSTHMCPPSDMFQMR